MSDDVGSIDQEIRINELREAAQEAAGGEMHAWENPDAPPEFHEQFWQDVLQDEQADETCHLQQLQQAGVESRVKIGGDRMRSTTALPVATAFSAVLLAHFLMSSCANAEGIVLTPPLEVGASVNLEMTMTRERKAAGQPAIRTTSITPVRVEVLQVSDEETIIGWTTGRSKLENPRLQEQLGENMDPLLALGVDQTMELVFDEEFTPHAIRNLDDMIKRCQTALDLLQESLPDDKAAAETISRVREMFSNPEVVQGILIQKPGRYFLIYGWELEPGVPREVEMGLPSPFGGEPLPATITIELKPIQPTDAQLLVSYKQTLDKEGVKRLIADAMNKFAGDRPGLELPTFNVEDSGEFKVNKETGWVEHALVKRTTTASEGSQVEEFECRLLAPPESK
jgi:hypothetical protein